MQKLDDASTSVRGVSMPLSWDFVYIRCIRLADAQSCEGLRPSLSTWGMLLGEGTCSVKMERPRCGSIGVILASEMTMVPSSRLLCRFRRAVTAVLPLQPKLTRALSVHQVLSRAHCAMYKGMYEKTFRYKQGLSRPSAGSRVLQCAPCEHV